MKSFKKLALLCTALLATMSLASLTACDFFGGNNSSSDSSTPSESSAPESSSSSGDNVVAEKTLALGANEIAVKASASTNAKFTATAAGKYALIAAPTETNASVKSVSGNTATSIALPYLFELEANATANFTVATANAAAGNVNLLVVKAKDAASAIDPDTGAFTSIALAANEIGYLTMSVDEVGEYFFEVSWTGAADFYVNGVKAENRGEAIQFAPTSGDTALFLFVATNPAQAVTVTDFAAEPLTPTSQSFSAKGDIEVNVEKKNSVNLSCEIMGQYGEMYSLTWTSDNAKVTVDGVVVEGKVVNVSNMSSINVSTKDHAAEVIDITVGDEYIPALNVGTNENVAVSEADAYWGAKYSFTATEHGIYTVSTTDDNAALYYGDDQGDSTTPLTIKAIANIPVIFSIGTIDGEADSFTIKITKTDDYDPFALAVNTSEWVPNVLSFAKGMTEVDYTFKAPATADYVFTLGGDCTAVATVADGTVSIQKNTIIKLAADQSITIKCTYTGNEDALGKGSLGTTLAIQQKYLVALGANELTLTDGVAEVEFITDVAGRFTLTASTGATVSTKSASWDDYAEASSFSVEANTFYYIKVVAEGATSATLTVARDDTLQVGNNTVALAENPDNTNQSVLETTFTAPETKAYELVCSSSYAVQYRASASDEWASIPDTGLAATAETTYLIKIISVAKDASAEIKVKEYVAPVSGTITANNDGSYSIAIEDIAVGGKAIISGQVTAGTYKLKFSSYGAYTVTVNGNPFEIDTDVTFTAMNPKNSTVFFEMTVVNEDEGALTDFSATLTKYVLAAYDEVDYITNALTFSSTYETKTLTFKGEANTVYNVDTTYYNALTVNKIEIGQMGYEYTEITSFTTDANGEIQLAITVPLGVEVAPHTGYVKIVKAAASTENAA